MTKQSGYFKGLWENRYILFSFVGRDLRSKYRRSLLGVLWSIITPLALSVIIGSVYAILFHRDVKIWIPMLFAGLNPWTFIRSSAESSTNAFIQAEGYLKQLRVHPQVFPLRKVCVDFINLLYSIMAFYVVYLVLQPQNFGPEMLMIVPGLLIIFVFSWGLAQIAAVANLFVRDYQPFQTLVMQAFFYLTPIIYQPSQLGEHFALVYRLNPFYYILDVVKQPLLGSIPSADTYLVAVGITLVVFALGAVLVNAARWKIAFKL